MIKEANRFSFALLLYSSSIGNTSSFNVLSLWFRFALLSHLFWAMWSVVQAKMSDIGFGYLVRTST